MAEFTQMSFSPETGLNDREVYPTTPLSESEARNSIQGLLEQIKTYINQTLLEQLHNRQSFASGAQRIGSAPISGVTGTTVYEQIENVREQMVAVYGGTPADNTVSASKIQDDAIIESKISTGAVSTTKIVDGAITNSKIASKAVTADKIADGAVDGSSLTNGSVGEIKIAALAVTESKIGENAVTHTKILNGEIIADKIAAGAVTQTKLGTIQTITMSQGDTISYDNNSDKLMLNVSGYTPVQLCPVVFGQDDSPPLELYPAGTLYIQYQP